MKTVRPTLEILEDRAVPSTVGTDHAWGSHQVARDTRIWLDLGYPARTVATSDVNSDGRRGTVSGLVVADFNNDGRLDLAYYGEGVYWYDLVGPTDSLQVGNGLGDVLGFIEQDNLYKFKGLSFCFCDGSVR